MPANVTNIAVAGLYTSEPYFDHFQVEMHTDTTGTNRVGVLEANGVWDTTNLRFAQTTPQYFTNATIGTTYYFRVAVADKYGNMSAWSGWISVIAGDSTAPGQAYSPSAVQNAGGIRLSANPVSPASDTDHYDFFWNTTNTAPTGTSLPNLPPSSDGTAHIIISGTENAYVWIRAVDTSGNEQAWTSLGGFSSTGAQVLLLGMTLDDSFIKNGDFNSGAFNWSFPNTNPAGNFLTGVAGLPRGATEFKSLASLNTWLQSSEKIPIDPTKTYLMECWLKIPAAGSINYGGFAEFDHNGTAVQHVPSGNQYGYCLFSALASTTGSTYQYFSAEITGSASSPTNNQFNSNAAFIQAIFLLNYTGSGTPQPIEVLGVRFSEVAAGSARALGAIDSGKVVLPVAIDFTRSYLNKNLDNIPDGSTYARVQGAGVSGGYVHNMKDGVGSVRIIKGVGDASTLSLDSEIVDGSTYARTVGAGLLSGYAVKTSKGTPPSIAFVQSNFAVGGVNGGSIAYSSNVTAGDLLIAVLDAVATASPVTTMSDTQGNVWSAIAPFTESGSGDGLCIWWCVAKSTGANTVSMTFSNSGTQSMLYVAEYSGVNALDVSALGQAVSTSWSSGGATTNFPNELVIGIGCGVNGSGSGALTAGAGFTARASHNLGFENFIAEDKIVSSTGSQTATATDTVSDNYGLKLLTFYYSGVGLYDIKGVGDASTLSLDNEVRDGLTYVRPGYVNADHTFHVTTPFTNQGSLISAYDNSAFSWNLATTSIAFWWAAFNIPRTDGGNYAVAAAGSSGSPAITLSGLTASTTYYVYCYYDILANTIHIVLSDRSSGTAAASPAFEVQTLNHDGHIFVWGTTIATPSSGTGGGGGGTGGGKCFSGNVKIHTAHCGLVDFQKLPRVVLIKNETGIHEADLLVHDFSGQMIDMGQGNLVTMNHLMRSRSGLWVPAAVQFPCHPKVPYKGKVFNLHVRTKSDKDRHYILENGEVAHNIKLN